MKNKSIFILLAELSLCGFAMYSCISHRINNPDESVKGAEPINFISYIVLAIFFIVLYISDKHSAKGA